MLTLVDPIKYFSMEEGMEVMFMSIHVYDVALRGNTVSVAYPGGQGGDCPL